MSIAVNYPSDDELVRVVRERGSVVKAAEHFGINQATLDRWIGKRNIRHRTNDARRQFKANELKKGTAEAPEVDQVAILKQELKEAKALLARQRDEDVRETRVKAAIVAAVAARDQIYIPKPITLSPRESAHSLVLLWSDLHAAEVVSSEQVNGANAYDWQIMLRRHDELRRGILSWAERFAPVDELVILGLGDMLSGNIHDELAETNEMPLAEATVQLGMDGAAFIASLAEEFPFVRFAGVVGNHPRAHRKPRSKQRYDNGDWTTYQIMSQILSKHENISFDVPKAQRHPVIVKNKRILAMHGDGIRSAMPDVPWGGIIRLSNKIMNQYSKLGLPLDHFALGHWHEPNVIKNRRIWVNGSVKGTDEFSEDRFGGGEPPAQLLLPFHPRWGCVGGQYIDLAHA